MIRGIILKYALYIFSSITIISPCVGVLGGLCLVYLRLSHQKSQRQHPKPMQAHSTHLGTQRSEEGKMIVWERCSQFSLGLYLPVISCMAHMYCFLYLSVCVFRTSRQILCFLEYKQVNWCEFLITQSEIYASVSVIQLLLKSISISKDQGPLLSNWAT